MPLYSGGGISGIGPQKFDTGVQEIKQDIAGVKTDTEQIKTDVASVKTAVDEIPTSLDADFTEVKAAISSIMDKLNYLEPLIRETHTASMDIYYGTYVTEWIEDLKKNGTSSETYKTPLRMEYLATYPDVVNNTTSVSGKTVEQIIFDYAIENNLNIGDYFAAKYYPNKPNFPEPVETIDDIIANATSFAWLCVNKNMNRPVFSNQECLGKIFDNKDSIGYILKNNIASNIYAKTTKYQWDYSTTDIPKTLFNGIAIANKLYLYDTTYLWYSATVEITMLDGSIRTIDGSTNNGDGCIGNYTITLNDFVTKITVKEYKGNGQHMSYVHPGVQLFGVVKP